MGDLKKKALSIGWPLFALLAGLFVYSLVSLRMRCKEARDVQVLIGTIAA